MVWTESGVCALITVVDDPWKGPVMLNRQNDSPRVLIVEDDYFIATSLSEELRLRGLKVVGPVSAGEDALRLMAAEAVDFAVLDLHLGGTLVFPVAMALQQAEIPFVFASGYDPGVIAAQFRDVPLHSKPFRADRLAAAAFATPAWQKRHLVPSGSRLSNSILRALPAEDLASILPHALRVGPMGVAPEAIAGRVLFPEKGFCSLSLADGAGVMIAMIGAEGSLGELVSHDGGRIGLTATWHPGSEYLAVPSLVFARVLQRSPELQRIAAQCRLSFVVQLAWTSEAHATLTIAENLARWIVMAHERIGAEIQVTHDELARAFGVRRAGVTNALHLLEGERWLRSTRGRILVLDVTALTRVAGRSYGHLADPARRGPDITDRPHVLN